jgi:hypothetical protein
MRLVLPLMLMLASAPAMAAAPRVTIEYGRDLQKSCNADRGTGEYAMCWSFVAAVLEVVNNNSIYGRKACVPPLVNVQHAVAITKSWLQGHPSAATDAASFAVTEALAEAYPCKVD